VPAVALTLSRLTGASAARRVLPFAVLAPAAIWVGVSGDAVFLGVSAWGVALLAVAVTSTGRGSDVAAVGGGLLLGAALYLSYGLVLLAPVVAVVLLVRRRWRPALLATAGVVAVAVLFTVSGFDWWEGYQQVRIRYAQGWGGRRPYWYWSWADLAVLAVVLGPAGCAGLGRWITVPRGRLRLRLTLPTGATAARWLALAALLAVVLATASGMSKAEVERIWLPFTAWISVAVLALPPRGTRYWLAGQAVVALAVQHLVLTPW
jgi:uncharacterized membrane protein